MDVRILVIGMLLCACAPAPYRNSPIHESNAAGMEWKVHRRDVGNGESLYWVHTSLTNSFADPHKLRMGAIAAAVQHSPCTDPQLVLVAPQSNDTYFEVHLRCSGG